MGLRQRNCDGLVVWAPGHGNLTADVLTASMKRGVQYVFKIGPKSISLLLELFISENMELQLENSSMKEERERASTK